jgi:agmatine/peptidylarginine deiminase
MIARGTPLTNYSFYVHGINDWWDRDSGPISFYYGLQDSIGMVDMDYYTIAALKDSSGNIYNDFNLINSGSRLFDDSIPLKISQKLGYPLYRTPLNDEGGNIISDGLGTFWGSDGTRRSNTTAQSLPFISDLEIFANYPLPTQAQFDTLFKKSFGLKGHVESKVFECDGGTGHIDIFGKLVDENTLALVDYSRAVNHPDFANWNTNLAMFKNVKGTNGKPIDINSVPMPLTPSGAFQTDCDTSVLFGTPDQKTYVNGIFVNKNYLMPIQSDATNPNAADKAAMAAFRKAMPGYKIVPVDASTMHGTGGAIHCITMQIPAENPLFIRHTALRGKQPLLSSYDIKADIKNRSGIMDAKVYYRKSGQTQWQSTALSQITEIQFTASLPSTGFALTDTIEYFIEAKSRNGKTMTKPFTAREGGYWRFTLTNSVSTKEEKIAENVQIFPNPSTGLFQIQGLDGLNEAVDVSVVSVLGQVISTQKVASGNAFLDLTNQPTGMYFAKFSGKNWQKTVRLVKN